MIAAERIHSMDNLRALAMLAGVVFHAALAYSPVMHPVWPAADAGRSVLVDAVAWFLHLFRMPLFFVVAGYFAALLVARRGLAGLFRNRCVRILLPLAVFLPPVLLSLHWLTARAAARVAQPSPALAWLQAQVLQHGTMPSAPGWAHLWFLFYLVLFTVMVWVASALELGRLGARISALPPVVVAAALPLLLTPALASVGVPWPAPQFLLPSLWALVFFGLYFGLGYLAFRSPVLFQGLRPLSPWLLGAALTSYAVLFWSTGGFAAPPASPLRHVLHAALEAGAGCWATLWCLLAASRWLAAGKPLLRWLADASYWVYLVHLPVLLAIQYRLMDLPWHWAAKFATSTAATLVVAFASYELVVRHTALRPVLGASGRSGNDDGAGEAQKKAPEVRG